MAKDATKVQMGICDVTLDGTDIGHTAGGVEAVYQPEFTPVKVDKYGNTAVDDKLTGEVFLVKVPLAEATVANINKAIAHSTLAGAGDARMTIGSNSGKSNVSKAVEIVLHPQDAGASRAYDVVLYKAAPISEIALNHKVDEQKTVMVEFKAYVDESKADGNYLGLIGDSAA